MKTSDPSQAAILEWYMEFISEDLTALSDLDLSIRALQVEHYVTKYAFSPSLDSRPEERPDPLLGPHDKFPRIQSRDPIRWKDVLLEIQSELKGFLELLMSAESGKTIDVEKVQLEIGSKDGTFCIGHSPLGFSRYGWFEPHTMAQMAKISFSHALEGIPKDAVKTCKNKECGRYFLHLSRKPKYYCNPKCTSRDLSRKRREKDPEAYRKKQREIMRKKYKEKKAEELGKKPDKVKIQKRTRATKKE